jgi:hypothetical protein
VRLRERAASYHSRPSPADLSAARSRRTWRRRRRSRPHKPSAA